MNKLSKFPRHGFYDIWTSSFLSNFDDWGYVIQYGYRFLIIEDNKKIEPNYIRLFKQIH